MPQSVATCARNAAKLRNGTVQHPLGHRLHAMLQYCCVCVCVFMLAVTRMSKLIRKQFIAAARRKGNNSNPNTKKEN